LQAIKKTKNETETTAVTAVGPGPKPLEEIAQEMEREREPLSTGVKADGGDFDATRPNAGKESQRKSFIVLLSVFSIAEIGMG
jgi:hypothetical protein